MAERGDVLRIRGDLAGAAAAYEQAITFGYEPQPGLALLWLAQGRTAAAVAAMQRLLGETGDPVHRSRLLPAAVEVLLGATSRRRRRPRRRARVDRGFVRLPVGAGARRPRGRTRRTRHRRPGGGDAAAAPARGVWERLGARYDTARCRVLLGRALRALGDDESARHRTDRRSAQLRGTRRRARRARSRRTDHAHVPRRAHGARGRGASARRGRQDQPARSPRCCSSARRPSGGT